MKTLIVVPAYNEQDNIKKLADELSSLNYDFLVVNDCSKDNTQKVLEDNNIKHLE